MTQILSNKQHQIAVRLISGHTPLQIARDLGIKMSTIRVHMSDIRKKLKHQHLEPKALKTHLDRYPAPKTLFPSRPLGNRMEVVLRLMSQGKNHKQIAAHLGISVGTSMNQACKACKRLAIIDTGWKRMILLKEHFAKLDGVVTMDDPFFN